MTVSSDRILVIDDDADALQLYKIILEKLGYTCTVAGNEPAAMEAYSLSLTNNAPFSVVILDLSIPGSANSSEIANNLRLLNSDIKIIAASGNGYADEIVNYKAHNFNYAMEKTFSSEKLECAIQKCFNE